MYSNRFICLASAITNYSQLVMWPVCIVTDLFVWQVLSRLSLIVSWLYLLTEMGKHKCVQSWWTANCPSLLHILYACWHYMYEKDREVSCPLTYLYARGHHICMHKNACACKDIRKALSKVKSSSEIHFNHLKWYLISSWQYFNNTKISLKNKTIYCLWYFSLFVPSKKIVMKNLFLFLHYFRFRSTLFFWYKIFWQTLEYSDRCTF